MTLVGAVVHREMTMVIDPMIPVPVSLEEAMAALVVVGYPDQEMQEKNKVNTIFLSGPAVFGLTLVYL